ncbi:MAG: hypothetical protein PHI97_31120 [Desulfobulbus sp.]|nr:hypothetical protein [Desulfobulbus sp.]
MSDIKEMGQSPALMPAKNGQMTSGQKPRSGKPDAAVFGGFDKTELSAEAKALSQMASKIQGSDGVDNLENLRPLMDQTVSESQASLYRKLIPNDSPQN